MNNLTGQRVPELAIDLKAVTYPLRNGAGWCSHVDQETGRKCTTPPVRYVTWHCECESYGWTPALYFCHQHKRPRNARCPECNDCIHAASTKQIQAGLDFDTGTRCSMRNTPRGRSNCHDGEWWLTAGDEYLSFRYPNPLSVTVPSRICRYHATENTADILYDTLLDIKGVYAQRSRDEYGRYLRFLRRYAEALRLPPFGKDTSAIMESGLEVPRQVGEYLDRWGLDSKSRMPWTIPRKGKPPVIAQ